MDDFLARLAAVVLKKGTFILRSGRTSEYYLDMKLAYGDPNFMNDLADRAWELMDKQATCIVEYGVGGRIAEVISSRHGMKLSIIRQEEKNHGTKKRIEGYVPTNQDLLVIPDDVFTTGSSLREATKAIEPTGARILEYIVLVDREEGDSSSLKAPLKSVYKVKQIIEAFKQLRG